MPFEIGSVRLFVCPSTVQDLRIGSSVLSFCLKLDSPKVRKVMKPDLLYIVPWVRRSQKVLKIPQNEVLMVLTKNAMEKSGS